MLVIYQTSTSRLFNIRLENWFYTVLQQALVQNPDAYLMILATMSFQNAISGILFKFLLSRGIIFHKEKRYNHKIKAFYKRSI